MSIIVATAANPPRAIVPTVVSLVTAPIYADSLVRHLRLPAPEVTLLDVCSAMIRLLV